MSNRIEVKSDIPGTVWKLEVKQGERVKEGENLMILESMKMEIPVVATDSGIVKEIIIGEGDPVDQDKVLLVLEQI